MWAPHSCSYSSTTCCMCVCVDFLCVFGNHYLCFFHTLISIVCVCASVSIKSRVRDCFYYKYSNNIKHPGNSINGNKIRLKCTFDIGVYVFMRSSRGMWCLEFICVSSEFRYSTAVAHNIKNACIEKESMYWKQLFLILLSEMIYF